MKLGGTLAGTAMLALVLGAVMTLGCPPNEAIVCSSSTENTLPSCAANYDLCAGGTDRIECKPVSATGSVVTGSGSVTCACIENGVTKKDFTTDDACNIGVDALKKKAADNCGWKLDEDSK
jgi:hypothetical protein